MKISQPIVLPKHMPLKEMRKSDLIKQIDTLNQIAFHYREALLGICQGIDKLKDEGIEIGGNVWGDMLLLRASQMLESANPSEENNEESDRSN